MAASSKTISILAPHSMKVSKIKIKRGQQVSKGTLVCLYTTDTNVTQKFKSNDGGIVVDVTAKEGEVVQSGSVLFTMQGCSHPTVMKDMCADCGADLRIENSTAGNRKEEVSASVAMVHSIPELIVSEELAKELGKADEERLLKTRKLVLLVDLDQTLIHTTNDNIPPNLKDVHHYQMWHGNQLLWYHTRLRPQTGKFLENISKLYELHICTFGSRMYAHTIARILDPEGKYFSHRILSRDECFNAQSKTANLKALFPCGDAMVCIIDDREDVWHFSPNLVHVKPYRFFQGTADINAPPGLTKTEHDSETLVHRVRKVSQSSTGSQEEQSVDKAECGTENFESQSSAGSKDEQSGDKIKCETEKSGSQSSIGSKDEQSVGNAESETEKNESQSSTGGKNENSGENVTHGTEGGIEYRTGSPEMDCNDKKHDSDTCTMETDSVSGSKDDKDHVYEAVKETDSVSGSKDEKDHVYEAVKSKEDIQAGNEIQKEELNSNAATTDVDKRKAFESANENKKMETSEKSSELEVIDTEETRNSPRTEEGKESGDGENEKSGKQKMLTDESKNDENEEEELIEWDDEDDYLFYLEETLKTIHSAFYDFYDQLTGKECGDKIEEKSEKPSLKTLIPYIKKKVLKGCNLLFSGVIPTNMTPEKSRAYVVAKALGASIHTQLKTKHNEKDQNEFTTHIVAAKHGTSKVRSAMKYKNVKKVSPDWLWSCAERWEKVEEILFPVPAATDSDDQGRESPDITKLQVNKSVAKRKRQSDNKKDTNEADSKRLKKVRSSNELDKGDGADARSEGNNKIDQNVKDGDKKKPDNFSMSYNPMLAFSDDDLAYMDKEVEDEMDDEDQSSEDENSRDCRFRNQVLKSVVDLDGSSSDDSLSGNMPRGWGLKTKMSPKSSSEDEMKGSSSPGHELGPEYESETDQDKFDKIMDAFGPETENSDEEYEESIGSVDEEIADAVVKEFLS